LTLRGLSILPGVTTPLHVGRRKSLSAIDEAMANGRRIVLATQKDEADIEPDPEDMYEIGALAEIRQVVRESDSSLRVTVQGIKRVRILRYLGTHPHYRVAIEEISDSSEATPEIQALVRGVMQQYEQYARLSKKAKPATVVKLGALDDPGRVADLIASDVIENSQDRQAVLEALDIRQRLEKVYEILTREVELLKLERKLQQRVQRQMERTHREYYLREQLRAIQKELGEHDERIHEIESFRALVANSDLPPAVEEKALHEIDRLEKMPPLAQEAVVVRSYLDWLLSLPWNTETEDDLDLNRAERLLEEDHHGLTEVKERILEYLAIRRLAPEARSPILCLVGPPGVGKTSLGRSIARALGRKFVRVSLGGIRDEAEIRGHRRTYVGAMPGRIIQGMRQAGSRNPVFLLDEIDKVGVDFRGDPAAALLEALDPEQNANFSDHYLELPFDLSRVIFVTTANVVHTMPRALLDRLEIIRIPGYTHDEKRLIAARHLWPRQLAHHGMTPRQVTISEGALDVVIHEYTREAGVRHLERQLARICRKAARQLVDGQGGVRVTTRNLHRFLGRPRFHTQATASTPEVGLATALAWTETGGQVMPVEVAVLDGQSSLILTGQLGEVMRESVQAAFSYLRSRWRQLGLEPGFHKQVDIHVHIPEGAVPKDGPSAGIAVAAALASALTGRPVRCDVAMTGEVTLRGRVLPVGGIREKILAAHRAGVATIILPRANERDLDEVPLAVRRRLTVHLVEHMDEVLACALLESSTATGATLSAGQGADCRVALPSSP
ncbi:MAG TPA: endopeptidase La, partial [Bacillota bacterium]